MKKHLLSSLLALLVLAIAVIGCDSATPVETPTDSTTRALASTAISAAEISSETADSTFKFQMDVPTSIAIENHRFEVVVEQGDIEIIREFVEVKDNKLAKTLGLGEGSYTVTVNVYELLAVAYEASKEIWPQPSTLVYTGSAKAEISFGKITPISIELQPVPGPTQATTFIVNLPEEAPRFFFNKMIVEISSPWRILADSEKPTADLMPCREPQPGDTDFVVCPPQPAPYESLELDIFFKKGIAKGSLVWTHGTLRALVTVTAYDANGAESFRASRMVKMSNGLSEVSFASDELSALEGGMTVKLSYPPMID